MIRTEGADDLDRLAAALREAADKNLQRRMSKAMRDVARPIGLAVLHDGAEEMPHAGGFSNYLTNKGRVGVSTALRGKVASVSVLLRNRGVQFKAMDAGILRHPVFADHDLTRKQWTWVAQSVAPGAFSRAFERRAETARAAVLAAGQQVLNDAAGEV